MFKASGWASLVKQEIQAMYYLESGSRGFKPLSLLTAYILTAIIVAGLREVSLDRCNFVSEVSDVFTIVN